MSYLDASLVPSQPFEAVEAVRDLVAGIAALTAKIPAAQIFAHRHPAAPSNTGWRRVVVRQPRDMQQPRLNSARSMFVQVDVMIEVHEDVERPDQFLAQAHKLVFENIVGQVLTLTRSNAPLGVMEARQPTPAMYDAGDHSYYATAAYMVGLLGVPTT